MTIKEIKTTLDIAGITYPSRARKKELVTLLLKAQAESRAAAAYEEPEDGVCDAPDGPPETITRLKIAVLMTGTRSVCLQNLLWIDWALGRISEKYPNADHAITLIHGDARGSDKHSAQVAEKLGWKVHAMPADWDRYGKRAGFIRNQRMVRSLAACSADYKFCVAFPSVPTWTEYQATGVRPRGCGTIGCYEDMVAAGFKPWVVPLQMRKQPPTLSSGRRFRVRGASEARESSTGDSPVRAKWLTEKSETRWEEKVDAPEGRAVYSVPDTGYEWIRQPNGLYSSYYEGELEESNLSWYEVKKWLNPDAWE